MPMAVLGQFLLRPSEYS